MNKIILNDNLAIKLSRENLIIKAYLHSNRCDFSPDGSKIITGRFVFDTLTGERFKDFSEDFNRYCHSYSKYSKNGLSIISS